jgi:hypothetical protein
LEGLAGAAMREGETEHAARLVGAAAALRQQIAAPIAAHRRAAHAGTVAAARERLGDAGFAAACQAGEAWSVAQAVAEASQLVETLAGARS